MEILCFFAGVAAFYLKSMGPVGLLCLFLFFRWRIRFVVYFILGISWSALHLWIVAPTGFGTESVLNKAKLQGVIVSIPVDKGSKNQFEFLVSSLNNKPAHARVQLSCYDHCPLLHAGDAWHITAKLKRTRNYNNPGGFDYVSSLKARHIDWVGYTLRGTFHPMTTKPESRTILLRLRASLAMMLEKIASNTTDLGILQALTIGVTQHIDSDTWGLFRRTGTTHLMVISGAHIGFVAGLTFSFFRIFWCRLGRMAEVIPAARVASFLGLTMGLCYALLAGFGVPAERAIVAFFIMTARYFLRVRFTVWQALQYALFFVLLFEPHAVLQSGFYLSFIAVAILISMNQRLSLLRFKKMLCLQIACLVGLMPLTLFWFSYGSVNGFLANLLAIPWVSFVIIPLGLFIVFFGTWLPMSWMMFIEHLAIDGLLYYLHWVDSLSSVNVTYVLTSFFSVLLLMFALILLVFIPLKQWYAVLVFLGISACLPPRDRIAEGDVRADVLDVGQGLAVVIRTRNHVLIYDTGMQFYHGTDMGKLVIIPYLQSQHIKHVDKVVISHPDLDHRGGLHSLSEAYPSDELLVDDPKYYQSAMPCHDYPSWTWDDVDFKFFPIKMISSGKNNRSCVLQISNPAGQVLLTGDIERAAEDHLVDQYGAGLASSVMLIPHHGSKTSSSARFVQAVRPQYAVVSYGFDNRYHFPHREAMRVYQKQHVPVFATETCGVIRLLLKHQDKAPQVSCPLTTIG